MGLAVLATLATSRTESLLAEGQDTASALTSGYHLAFAVGASFMVTGIVLAAIVLGPEGARAGEEGLVYSGSHDG